MLEVLKRMFRAVDPLKAVGDEFEADIVAKMQIIRDGVQLRFLQRKSDDYIVLLERRTKPFLRATFLVNGVEAVAWREHGEVPPGEIAELFEKFQLGIWPER